VNRSKKNFQLVLSLLVTLIAVTISSLVLEKHNPGFILWGIARSSWVLIHAVSALALLAGTAIHLNWHFDWIKTVFSPSKLLLPARIRHDRTVNLLLFGWLAMLEVSGLLIWPMAGNLTEGNPLANTIVLGLAYHAWKSLHSWCAVLMFIFIIVHLCLHWNWICSIARRFMSSGSDRTEV
jgi:hypothetical protein